MNRPKQTRKIQIVKPLGAIPLRVGPNHHKRFRQPKGYATQLTAPDHHHPRGERLALAA